MHINLISKLGRVASLSVALTLSWIDAEEIRIRKEIILKAFEIKILLIWIFMGSFQVFKGKYHPIDLDIQ